MNELKNLAKKLLIEQLDNRIKFYPQSYKFNGTDKLMLVSSCEANEE